MSNYSSFFIEINGIEPVYRHDAGVIASIFIALLSFLFTCLVNGLASKGPNSKLNNEWLLRRKKIWIIEFFNKSTAQVSDENPTEFTPAGPTFSLWGLIYTWQVRSKIIRTIYSLKRNYSI